MNGDIALRIAAELRASLDAAKEAADAEVRASRAWQRPKKTTRRSENSFTFIQIYP